MIVDEWGANLLGVETPGFALRPGFVCAAAWPFVMWRASVSVSERVLGFSAIWQWASGRMASGIWPCGLWTLAAWRGLICARCPCPNGALWWLAPAGTKRPTMGFSLIGALPGLNQRRQGGRECAVR